VRARAVTARIARASARWTGSGGCTAWLISPKSSTSCADGARLREAEAVDVEIGEAAHERVGVRGGAQLDADAALPRELAVPGAGRDGHRLALAEEVLAALDHQPHRALDHLVALGLDRVDMGLGEQPPGPADDVELEERPVRLLRRLADLDADAQPRVGKRGHPRTLTRFGSSRSAKFGPPCSRSRSYARQPGGPVFDARRAG
jgi:hypothetical protein